MKKILVGFIMNGRGGGVDKYLLNFLNIIQNDNVQVDFLTNEIDSELKERLSCYNSKLYAVANLKHPVKQYRQVSSILKKGNYDIVYWNISTAIDLVSAIAAKNLKVKKRIIHSHSSGNDFESTFKRKTFDAIHYLCRLFLYRMGTHFYGCSKKAGLWLFPRSIVESDQFKVIYNAVDREQFSYDREIRKNIRTELDIENRFAIGHVGNFCYQKNHVFLIQIFKEVLKSDPEAVLLLAGDGVQCADIQQKVGHMGIAQSVRFLGWCKHPEILYSGLDLFLLPSNFEGLPVVGVEAQSTGLQCIMSDSITEEAKIIDRCYFLSLKSTPGEWAKFIIAHKDYDRNEVEFLPVASKYSLKEQKRQLKQLILE